MNDELKDNNINKQTKEARISAEDMDKNVRKSAKEKMLFHWGQSSQIMWLLITFLSLVFNTIMVKVTLAWLADNEKVRRIKNKENLPLPLHPPRLPTKRCSESWSHPWKVSWYEVRLRFKLCPVPEQKLTLLSDDTLG